MLDYALIVNILGYPAGVMPATKVREDEQVFDDGVGDYWTDLNREVAQNSKGMPVTV